MCASVLACHISVCAGRPVTDWKVSGVTKRRRRLGQDHVNLRPGLSQLAGQIGRFVGGDASR